MSYVQLSEGGFQVFTPLACDPGSPELSKSYMDMASKLFTFTFTMYIIIPGDISRLCTSAKGQA